MKKNVIELNSLLSILKRVAPVHDQEYIRLIWSITNHIEISSRKGKEQEIEIMTDLRNFISLLNKKYSITNEDISFVSYLIP